MATQITGAERRRLLELVHAYGDAAQRSAYAEEGSTAFGSREECRAVVDAAYGELGDLVFGWPLVGYTVSTVRPIHTDPRQMARVGAHSDSRPRRVWPGGRWQLPLPPSFSEYAITAQRRSPGTTRRRVAETPSQ